MQSGAVRLTRRSSAAHSRAQASWFSQSEAASRAHEAAASAYREVPSALRRHPEHVGASPSHEVLPDTPQALRLARLALAGLRAVARFRLPAPTLQPGRNRQRVAHHHPLRVRHVRRTPAHPVRTVGRIPEPVREAITRRNSRVELQYGKSGKRPPTVDDLYDPSLLPETS